jgi:hypothetical protein
MTLYGQVGRNNVIADVVHRFKAAFPTPDFAWATFKVNIFQHVCRQAAANQKTLVKTQLFKRVKDIAFRRLRPHLSARLTKLTSFKIASLLVRRQPFAQLQFHANMDANEQALCRAAAGPVYEFIRVRCNNCDISCDTDH